MNLMKEMCLIALVFLRYLDEHDAGNLAEEDFEGYDVGDFPANTSSPQQECHY